MKRIFFLFIFCLGVAPYPPSADSGTQPRIDIAKTEQQIHQLINRERQSQGLPALAWDEQLTAIARDHSLDMARHHFFSHENLHGENATVRGKKRGWNKKKQIGPNTWLIGLAENIFLNHLYDKVVKTVQAGITLNQEYGWNSQEKIAHLTVQEWMKSLSHRKNILSPMYDRHGIGVAISGGEVLITEDLF